MTPRSSFLVVAFLFAGSSFAQWTQRVSLSQPERLVDAAWDGTRFIAVGGYGAVRTSTDGIHWSDQTLPGNPNLWSVVSNGHGLSVALDDQMFTWTTNDGITWIRSSSAMGTGNWEVRWTGSRFVGSPASSNGVSKSARASQDGISWLPDSTLGDGCDSAVVAEAGLELRLSSSGAYARRPGQQWAACSTGTTTTFNDLGRGGGLWVLVADSGKILSSSDAKSWNQVVIASGVPAVRMVAYRRGLWMALARRADSLVLYTSSDAVAWTRRLRFPELAGLQYAAAWRSKFLADSSRWAILEDDEVGQMAVSENGVNWRVDTLPGDGPLRTAVNDLVSQVAVSNGAGILVCRGNGILAWRQGQSPWVRSDSAARSNLVGIAHKDGIWLAGGVQPEASVVWRSTDGVNWSAARIRFAGSFQGFLRGVFAARGLFIVSGVSDLGSSDAKRGSTLVSEDGLAWTNAGDCLVSKLADNGKILVSASTSALEVCSSEDGRTWTRRKQQASYNGMYDVRWNGSLFVATGAGNTLWTSPDGIDWSVPDLGGSRMGDLYDLGWNGTLWSIRGTSGSLVSSDGTNWTALNSNSIPSPSVGTAWKQWFVVQDKFSYAEQMDISKDGTTWENIPLDTQSVNGRVIGFHDLGDTLYAFSNEKFLHWTADPHSWTRERFTSNAILAMDHAYGLLVAVGENSNIWTRPTTAIDVGIRPNIRSRPVSCVVAGGILRIPGGNGLSAELLDLEGRSMSAGRLQGDDLVVDLRGLRRSAAILRIREGSRTSTRMLALP
jgi:hypothetical protein